MMTIKELAEMLDNRKYTQEITPSEEAMAKELGFVVVFGYSDDCIELRGAIDDEIGRYGSGEISHVMLPDVIYADWCPDDIDCAWAFGTAIPHEKFHIFDFDELYCVGIVCDINKPTMTNADHIRSMSDEELAVTLAENINACPVHDIDCEVNCKECWLEWLKQPYKEKEE